MWSVQTYLRYKNPCSSGANYAYNFNCMEDVWDACPRADWVLWMLNHAIYDKEEFPNLDVVDFRTFAISLVPILKKHKEAGAELATFNEAGYRNLIDVTSSRRHYPSIVSSMAAVMPAAVPDIVTKLKELIPNPFRTHPCPYTARQLAGFSK